MTPAAKKYSRDLIIGFTLYSLVLVGVNLLAEHVAMPTALLIPVVLLPMLPIAMVLRAILIFARSWDELQRKIAFEALLAAALIVGGGSFAWGFVEGIPGMPRLPVIWIMPALLGVHGLALPILRRRYR